MIRVENLHYHYDNNTVLCNIDFSVNKGEFIAIIGPNGSGKTTLMKCILGMNKTKNCIYINGTDIAKLKNYTIFGYVSQKQTKIHEVPITGYEYLKLVAKDINGVIKMLNLDEFIHENMNKLSGGQRQRIAIAAAILHKTEILIMDEPNTGLDEESRRLLYKSLSILKKQGITIVLVSHYIDELSCVVDYVYDIKTKEKRLVEKDECGYC